MAYISNYQYYENGGNSPANLNWGSYQYMSMREIVSNFQVMYVGNDKEINNVKRHEIVFHAKRAIKEYNQNVFNLPKVLEMTIGDTLQMVLPPDYINYIRIYLENNGVLFRMTENKQLNYANAYLQDSSNRLVFDVDGNVIETTSQLDIERLAGNTQQLYTGQGQFNGQYGWYSPGSVYGDWYFTRSFGGDFSMNPDTANINPVFNIDKRNGVINFSSDIVGMNVVLEYISDGMENGDESAMFVPKMAETAMYAYMKWAILDQKYGVQEYVKKRARKEYQVARDNAKLALGGIHLSRLLMVLRGQQQWNK